MAAFERHRAARVDIGDLFNVIQECIIIRTSADTFDVIVGRRLNDRPVEPG
jgi:hypothetical protein